MSRILDAIQKAEEARQKNEAGANEKLFVDVLNDKKTSKVKKKFIYSIGLIFFIVATGFYIYFALADQSYLKEVSAKNKAVLSTTGEINNVSAYEKTNESQSEVIQEETLKPIDDASSSLTQEALIELSDLGVNTIDASFESSDGLVTLTESQPVVSKQSLNQDPAKSESKSGVANKSTSAWKESIVINAIVYNEDQEKAFTLIKSKRLTIGDTIPETDYKIVRILKNGLVVDDGNGSMLITSH